jgi:hypothetical protein
MGGYAIIQCLHGTSVTSTSLSLRDHLVLIIIQERKWKETQVTSNNQSGTLVRVPHIDKTATTTTARQ